MIQSIIKFVLSRLAGVTPRQWAVAVFYVTQVAKSDYFKNGKERRDAVVKSIKKQWPEIQDSVVNLLIEVALAFTRSK
jgi:hypothetical protein